MVRITRRPVFSWDLFSAFIEITKMSDEELIDELEYYFDKQHEVYFNLKVIEMIVKELKRRGYKLKVKVVKKGNQHGKV